MRDLWKWECNRRASSRVADTPESQVQGDRRERRTFCNATAYGSLANGIAPQGKVVWSGRENLRRRVFAARKHNLASSAFGSIRCRSDSYAGGTTNVLRKPCRTCQAGARGAEEETPRIEAHAGEHDTTARLSVTGIGEEQRGRDRGSGSSRRNERGGKIEGIVRLHKLLRIMISGKGNASVYLLALPEWFCTRRHFLTPSGTSGVHGMSCRITVLSSLNPLDICGDKSCDKNTAALHRLQPFPANCRQHAPRPTKLAPSIVSLSGRRQDYAGHNSP